jgi:hypothetical protein
MRRIDCGIDRLVVTYFASWDAQLARQLASTLDAARIGRTRSFRDVVMIYQIEKIQI